MKCVFTMSVKLYWISELKYASPPMYTKRDESQHITHHMMLIWQIPFTSGGQINKWTINEQ